MVGKETALLLSTLLRFMMDPPAGALELEVERSEILGQGTHPSSSPATVLMSNTGYGVGEMQVSTLPLTICKS